MLFMIRFTDDREKLSLRYQHHRAHQDFVEQHKDQILSAGSLHSDADSSPSGALWIVDVPTRAAAEELYTRDPYWVSGLRVSADVMVWRRCWTTGRLGWANVSARTG
jgi:uncharacterized protein YciI